MHINENYWKYLREYLDLQKEHPQPGNKEIDHRKKILKEWIDNELDKWKKEQN